MLQRTAREAEAFLRECTARWHQRFELAENVWTPGVSKVDMFTALMEWPEDMSEMSVIDIGTSNGGVAFEAERRGAGPVVAVDIVPPETFGFSATRAFLGSRAKYVQASVYELPALVKQRFDVVAFLGVLYHLRHPLLALDAVRQVTDGVAFIETELADDTVPNPGEAVVRFFEGAELADDTTNWFAPTSACLEGWCRTSGLEPSWIARWPRDECASRGILRAVPVDPAYLATSYERQLDVRVPHKQNIERWKAFPATLRELPKRSRRGRRG